MQNQVLRNSSGRRRMIAAAPLLGLIASAVHGQCPEVPVPDPGQWAVVVLDSGPSESFALGTDGVRQAGYVGYQGSERAGLWSGAPGTLVDLHPSWAQRSWAMDVDGDEVVGRAMPTSSTFTVPVLWRWGGAQLVTLDLSPPHSAYGALNAVSGGQQVGSVFAPQPG